MFLMIAIVLLASSPSYAAVAAAANASIDFTNGVGLTLYGDDATAGNDVSIGRTSTNVGVAWQTNVNGYALMTQHKSGTKAYGSSYDSTAIYQTAGAVDPGTPAYNGGALTATDTKDFTGSDWNEM
jgi:hypothetical protein